MADQERLSVFLQESISTAVALVDDDNSTLIAGLIDPELLDPPLNTITIECIKYRKKYKRPPGQAHIEDLFEDILGDEGHKQHQRFKYCIKQMYVQAGNLDTKFVLDKLQDFMWIRQNRIKLEELGLLYKKGGENLLDELERCYREGLKIRSGIHDIGFNLADSRAFGFFERSSSDYCLINIPELDQYGVHPTKNEVLLLQAAMNRGKCIDANTLILLPNGTRKRIEDVVLDKDPEVMSFDQTTGTFIPATVSEHLDNKERECFLISTRSGHSIVTTKEHPFLTPDGWKPLSDLGTSDYIAASKYLPSLGTEEYGSIKVRLLGYLISDAHLGIESISYTKHDKGVMGDVINCVDSIGDKVTFAKGDNNIIYIVGAKHGVSHTMSLVRECGLGNTKSNRKFVPNFIFGLSDNLIIEFLKGLFSGDSAFYISPSGASFEYISASSNLVEDVKHLLIRLGISSSLKYFKARFNKIKISGYARLSIKNKGDLAKLIDLVGSTRENTKKMDMVRKACDSGTIRGKYYTKPGNDNFYYDRIKEIRPVGTRKTFDLTVSKYHNFVAEDLIVHNSWFVAHCGKYGVLQGWKVAHITLENSKEMTAQRYYQSMFSGVKREGSYHYTRFDDDKKELQLKAETLKPKFIIDHRESSIEYLNKSVKEFRHKMENLYIKEFPTGQLTFDGYESYLDELELREKFIPDMVLLDSPQLMKLNRNKENYLALDDLYTDLRGSAVARNYALVTTHQGNREAEKAKLLHSYHASGSIGVFRIVDNAITYSQTDSEEKHGLARLYTQKVRNDSARVTVCITQHYPSGQFCLSSRMMTDELKDKINSYVGRKPDEDLEEDD